MPREDADLIPLREIRTLLADWRTRSLGWLEILSRECRVLRETVDEPSHWQRKTRRRQTA